MPPSALRQAMESALLLVLWKGVRHAVRRPTKRSMFSSTLMKRMFHGVESISRPIRWRKPARRFPSGKKWRRAGDAPES